MQHLWIFLILLYGIFKGLREALKKKATEVSVGMPFEVLYLISQEVFVGQCGQKYYTLRLVP